MPIGEILEKSFNYPWKNKALWFYGIILAIFSGLGSVSQQVDSDSLKEAGININFSDPNTVAWIVAISIIALFVTAVGIVVASWATAALINGTLKAEDGKKIDRKKIGQVGKGTIWRLIKLTVLLPIAIGLPLIVGLVVLAASLLSLPQPWITLGICVVVLVAIALVVVLIYLSLVWNLAIRNLVAENQGVIDSLKNSANMLKGNAWKTLLVTVLLGLITGTAGVLGFLPLILLILIGFGFFAAKLYIGAWILGFFALSYLAFYVIFEGYFMAFSQTGLTLWWKHLKGVKKKNGK